ncbi:predicted protein [Naegleria gruberi]|uniref:Predicted protein n=1 Tax=Naegleria gruberi TaxID=5762 RepID=D2W6U4_NAEGR|nr:uncharacterized protein NAEGRDRAFT_77138 [Naegleria gruberi]EFC35208.1 predicted protein [Naegleria gruberi]|eukprot:XP_002667952.1 predicted protein [Naegleria gruberi strain NEG-M]
MQIRILVILLLFFLLGGIFVHQASAETDHSESNSLFDIFTNIVSITTIGHDIEYKKQILAKIVNSKAMQSTLQSVKEMSNNLMEKGGELFENGKQEVSAQYSKVSNSETLQSALQSVKETSNDLLEKTIDFVKQQLDVIPPSEQESPNQDETKPREFETIKQEEIVESAGDSSKKEVKQEESSTEITIHPKYSDRMNFKRSTSCEFKTTRKSNLLLSAAAVGAGTTIVSAA